MLSVAPRPAPDGQLQLHASTVVIAGRAVALAGPAGGGKSGAALALMGRGAALLADDITWFARSDGGILASCPPSIAGRIEARGIGILTVPAAPPAPLALIVDLGTLEQARLPEPRVTECLGAPIRLLHKADTPHFIDGLYQYMLHSRTL
ncbi:HPr kinase/phosphorylase [Thalassorhabdomicrobium marinisediminis]|uniref:HPr kinase/phosphorylase n=1 Tax=Thalassorhabdomicrobium marinisediminis TaxID=2170577 RepID=UPI002490A48A|nr:serine/threonine protein kinase [Thalassorhabdomicrobium marinisediminis]